MSRTFPAMRSFKKPFERVDGELEAEVLRAVRVGALAERCAVRGGERRPALELGSQCARIAAEAATALERKRPRQARDRRHERPVSREVLEHLRRQGFLEQRIGPKRVQAEIRRREVVAHPLLGDRPDDRDRRESFLLDATLELRARTAVADEEEPHPRVVGQEAHRVEHEVETVRDAECAGIHDCARVVVETELQTRATAFLVGRPLVEHGAGDDAHVFRTVPSHTLGEACVRDDHRACATRVPASDAVDQPVQRARLVQPPDRRCRLGPQVANLESPRAPEPGGRERTDGRHGNRRRRGEDHVGPRKRQRANGRREREREVVGSAPSPRAVDAARRPDPVMSDPVDRLGAVRAAVAGRNRTGHVVHGRRNEIDVPAPGGERAEQPAMPVDPGRPACGGVLINAEEPHRYLGLGDRRAGRIGTLTHVNEGARRCKRRRHSSIRR